MHHGGVTSLLPAPSRASGTSLRADAAAAGLTTLALVLLGAPVGLLWAAVAPRVPVVLSAAGPNLVDPETGAFAGADVAFGGLVLLVGAVCGFVAFLLGRRYGPGVVVGLLAGGLVAAWVAKQTGEQVGLDDFRTTVRDLAARGTIEASVRLRASEAIVLWPVGALAAFAGAVAVRGDSEPGATSVS
ncbi:MAG: hypothetical protein JWN17_868 [Frankiales bacterium]|nr:hypothetical protein [Frankiales bacterium]